MHFIILMQFLRDFVRMTNMRVPHHRIGESALPVDPELLKILRCPVTKASLSLLNAKQLEKLNAHISAGDIEYADGSKVEREISEGLITETGTRVYRIDSGIPVMLEEQSIPIQSVK